MKYIVVSDGSIDISRSLISQYDIKIVDFHIYSDGEKIDRENLQDGFKNIGEITSSCPKPKAYYDSFIGHEEIYVITMSSKLSGSFNSAMVAKDQYLEDYPDTFIHIFDSKGASSCQTMIAMMIHRMIRRGYQRKTLVEIVEENIKNRQIYFISEILDNLKRNGRLLNVGIKFATILKMKFVMCGAEGEIRFLGQDRSSKKALKRLIKSLEKGSSNIDKGEAVISHVNNEHAANMIRTVLLGKLNYRRVEVVEASFINSLYCGEKGVIVTI